MSHRLQRIGDTIRHVLAQLIQEEVRDPRVGFVTVTAVRVAADLRSARVYVSVLGDRDGSLAALKRASPFLRRRLAQSASLKHTPELRFLFDDSIEKGNRVESLLDEWSRDHDDDVEPEGEERGER